MYQIFSIFFFIITNIVDTVTHKIKFAGMNEETHHMNNDDIFYSCTINAFCGDTSRKA